MEGEITNLKIINFSVITEQAPSVICQNNSQIELLVKFFKNGILLNGFS